MPNFFQKVGEVKGEQPLSQTAVCEIPTAATPIQKATAKTHPYHSNPYTKPQPKLTRTTTPQKSPQKRKVFARLFKALLECLKVGEVKGEQPLSQTAVCEIPSTATPIQKATAKTHPYHSNPKKIHPKYETHNFKNTVQRYDRLEQITEIKHGKVLQANCYLINSKEMWEKAREVYIENSRFFVDSAT